MDPSAETGDEIDWKRVWELRDEIGGSEFDEVVELFLSETETLVDNLLAVEPGALEQELHALKGAAMNLGFSCLAKICAEGERLASGGRGSDVSLSPILAAFSESRQAFLDGLSAEAPG